MKIVKKFKGLITTFVLCFVVPFALFFILNTFVLDQNINTFAKGYTFCGVDLGGLTQQEAEEKMVDYLETNSPPINLTIKYKDKTWSFNEQDFKLKTNIHTIIESSYKTNRKGGYFNKVKNIKKAKHMGFDNKTNLTYSFCGIEEKVERICKDIEKEAIDSKIKFNTTSRTFDISASKEGISVDRNQLYKDILTGLENNNDVNVVVISTNLTPTLTEEKIKLATKKQASFSTNYEKSNLDRKNNIKLATKSLDGYCVMPQEEFSFNKAIGKRTMENGYKEANIIKDGKFVKGLGGGVCQVSTTLYNALLLANIEVTEAHKHSLPISYVQPGFDAMVSWSSADLKFVNNTDLPIFITGNCDGKTITFDIYGNTKPDNMKIKTSCEIVKKYNHKGDKIIPDKQGLYADKIMFKGEYYRVKYPKDGYEAKAYIEYYINEKFEHKKQIRHTTYEAQQGIVYEGCETLPEGMRLPKDKYTTLNN